MTREQLMSHVEATAQKCLDIMRKKNADYSTIADPFLNFKNSASLLNIPVEKTFLVEDAKKLTRIVNLLSKDADVDESIDDSIEDKINYLLLLHAYLKHKRTTRRDTSIPFPDTGRIIETGSEGANQPSPVAPLPADEAEG